MPPMLTVLGLSPARLAQRSLLDARRPAGFSWNTPPCNLSRSTEENVSSTVPPPHAPTATTVVRWRRTFVCARRGPADIVPSANTAGGSGAGGNAAAGLTHMQRDIRAEGQRGKRTMWHIKPRGYISHRKCKGACQGQYEIWDDVSYGLSRSLSTGSTG
ncbi:hypothetical protein C8Q76DRAFT_762919 [Earliella scabrosa]|nr:hypothetical protein C8Q76DRAFT_762919 [Earliella scabrosa]